jgi:hypothetical protein
LKIAPKAGKLAQKYFLEEHELPRLLRLKIGQIEGIHPAITSLLKDLAPRREVSDKVLSREALLRHLEVHPISIQKFEKTLCCVGSVQLFEIAKKRLHDEAELVCLLTKTAQQETLQKRAVEELILGTVINGISVSDVRIAGRLAKNAASAQLLKIGENKAEKWVADIYGVDRRTVKSLTPSNTVIPKKTVADYSSQLTDIKNESA